MEERTKRMMGKVALSLGTVSTFGIVYFWQRKRRKKEELALRQQWARPGMEVTFRAELMPGREKDARTFRVGELLTSDRVTLVSFAGEHTRDEFEPLRLD